MASQIDATLPADGILADKADIRTNFGFAGTEITALQDEVTDALAALGLTSGDALFPPLGGTFTPVSAANLLSIILAIDTALAAVNSGGGATTLAGITDILTPNAQIRRAFQAPTEVSNQSADFNFDEGSMAGQLITLDNASNSVRMTLPAATSIANDDGYLCSVTCTSSVEPSSIAAPANELRFQQGRNGVLATHTEIFLGLSRPTSIRSVIHIFKDGPVYVLDGPGRITETDALAVGDPQSLNASSLVNLSLLAAAFPNLLNLGGTKQAGGSRSIIRSITGTGVLAQADAGNMIVHTGAGAAVWDVPDLLDGTTIEIENDGGVITLATTGAKAVRNPTFTQVPANGSAAVRFRNGVIKYIGTVEP